jgi:hypothetical protein
MGVYIEQNLKLVFPRDGNPSGMMDNYKGPTEFALCEDTGTRRVVLRYFKTAAGAIAAGEMLDINFTVFRCVARTAEPVAEDVKDAFRRIFNAEWKDAG